MLLFTGDADDTDERDNAREMMHVPTLVAELKSKLSHLLGVIHCMSAPGFCFVFAFQLSSFSPFHYTIVRHQL